MLGATRSVSDRGKPGCGLSRLFAWQRIRTGQTRNPPPRGGPVLLSHTREAFRYCRTGHTPSAAERLRISPELGRGRKLLRAPHPKHDDPTHGSSETADRWVNSHGYDVVRLLRIAWPQMSEADREVARAEMRKMIDFCLAHLRPDGSFDMLDEDTLGSSFLFPVSLLNGLG
jgi:hypothetical protein